MTYHQHTNTRYVFFTAVSFLSKRVSVLGFLVKDSINKESVEEINTLEKKKIRKVPRVHAPGKDIAEKKPSKWCHQHKLL